MAHVGKYMRSLVVYRPTPDRGQQMRQALLDTCVTHLSSICG